MLERPETVPPVTLRKYTSPTRTVGAGKCFSPAAGVEKLCRISQIDTNSFLTGCTQMAAKRAMCKPPKVVSIPEAKRKPSAATEFPVPVERAVRVLTCSALPLKSAFLLGRHLRPARVKVLGPTFRSQNVV